MRVAVIPARGGSKRIPRKNIRPFCGKPMMAWPIDAAKRSGVIDRVIVSTDDPEIADVAKSLGAEVPFMRPANLADDYAGTTEVIGQAVTWMQSQGWPLEAVCCLYATAVFVQPTDLAAGLTALKSGPWAYAFSVTTFAAPIFRAFEEHKEGGVEMFFPDRFQTRSQDLPEALHDAGQWYWGTPQAWTGGLRIFDRHSRPVRIPSWRVQDIDTEDDWHRAELIHKAIMSEQNV